MRTFPINLNLAGLPVLVVGGGAMAAEKLGRLIPHQPRLTLLSPELGPETAALRDAYGLPWLQEPYDPRHLKGHRVVFAATDSRAVNQKIFDDTRSLCMLVNAVDMPDCCDFIMPAVIAGDNFSIAISTGGLAAGYARQWREQLEEAVHREDDILVALEQVRALLKRKLTTFDARRERLWVVLRELEAIEKSGS